MRTGIAEDDEASENSGVIHYSNSEDAMSDADSFSPKGHVPSPDDWCLEDDIICGSMCTCGAES